MKRLKLSETFEYLDVLRDSGQTNMFGATPYLQMRFGMDQPEAKKVLVKWMETFDEDLTPEERADKLG